jgi:hypothetical protein
VSSCGGASVTLTVVASGSPTLTYQWRKDGSPISGAVSSSYNIASLSAADAGSYDCVVTNACSSATSSAASVEVLSALVVATQPADTSVCAGGVLNLSVVAEGATGYQWTKGGVPLADGLTGSGSVVSGAITANLSISNVSAPDAGSYACEVSAPCASTNSASATVTIADPVIITTQPVHQFKCLTGSVTFTVAATGSAPISYQWRKNGVPIGGETSPSLTINPVVTTSGGSYDCVVSNSCGNQTSDAATFTVCVGDFNCSGLVSVQDIFDFLAAYFANDPRADVNGSGVISVQDIFDFLAAYFAGCA